MCLDKRRQCSSPPSSTPSSPNYQETDGVVESLQFADDDTLLRVGIGKESNPNRSTRVQYLGNPSSSSSSSKGQCLEYWRENLNQVYLDSVALATLLPDNDHKTAFKGLRLFPTATAVAATTSSRSFIAALQTKDTRGYCIAEINHHHHHHQGTDVNVTITVTRHPPSRTDHYHSPNTTTTTTIQEETQHKTPNPIPRLPIPLEPNPPTHCYHPKPPPNHLP